MSKKFNIPSRLRPDTYFLAVSDGRKGYWHGLPKKVFSSREKSTGSGSSDFHYILRQLQNIFCLSTLCVLNFIHFLISLKNISLVQIITLKIFKLYRALEATNRFRFNLKLPLNYFSFIYSNILFKIKGLP